MCYKFPLLFILLSLSMAAFTQDNDPDLSYVIMAKKNHHSARYSPGTHLCIWYRSDSSTRKLRGYYEGVSNGMIIFAPRKKKASPVLVAADNIILLRKIAPGKRILLGAMGTGMIVGSASVLNSNDSHGSAMGRILLIPVIGAGVYCVLSTPIILLIEKSSERKQKNGWSFSVEKNKL